MTKPLRVLHIYRTYYPETQGGGQESIRQLCLSTQSFGVENTVFALARNPVPAIMQLSEAKLVRARSWFEIASCDFGGPSAFVRCKREAATSDVIQIHYPWPFADLMLPFIRKQGQPVVVTYVSDIVRQRGLGAMYAPLQRRLLKAATRIVASSNNYVNSSEVLGQHLDKIACIPHCMQDGPPLNVALCADWEKRLGRDFFLFVGVLRYYKGLDYLISAAAQVKSRIVIVGEGPEGAKLRDEALRLGLTNVEFMGALPDEDKNALFSLCRGVVFPSHLRSEAFGMALLEGARAGKPLISCEIGTGTSWVNRHGESGIVIAPEDPSALAAAMNTLAQDEALCARLGAGARARWHEHFSPIKVGQAYRQIYDDLVDQASLTV